MMYWYIVSCIHNVGGDWCQVRIFAACYMILRFWGNISIFRSLSLHFNSYALITMEFLNSLELGGGFPCHALYLCKNAPIMLLLNVDPKCGLCNGTWFICNELYHRVIKAKIINVSHAKDMVFIPRIDFITRSLIGFWFEMRCRQLPIRLALKITTNKPQGQILKVLGLHLATPALTHG